MSKAYLAHHYALVSRVERRHFWFLGREAMLRSLVRRFLTPFDRQRVCEVGCGTGSVIRVLERMGLSVVGIDVNARALMYARRFTKARLVRQSIYSYNPKQPFSAVTLCDVLEHQQQDRRLLSKCRQILTPGGMLFLTVPAGQWLWDIHDELAGHQRRYEPGELLEKIETAGFSIIFWNYWNVLSLPLYALWRRMGREHARANGMDQYVHIPHPWVNGLLHWFLLLENALLFRVRFPIGATLVVCARKT